MYVTLMLHFDPIKPFQQYKLTIKLDPNGLEAMYSATECITTGQVNIKGHLRAHLV